MGLEVATIFGVSITLGEVIAAGGAAAGAAGTVAGGVINYQQQSANADAQAKAAERNARLEQLEADQLQNDTLEMEKRQKQEQSRLRSMQAVRLAKSGVALTGSPLAVLGETASNQQLENLDLRRKGATLYNQHIAQQQNYLYQSRVANSQNFTGSLLSSGLTAGANLTGGLVSTFKPSNGK